MHPLIAKIEIIDGKKFEKPFVAFNDPVAVISKIIAINKNTYACVRVIITFIYSDKINF
jgi:hypothetical protein